MLRQARDLALRIQVGRVDRRLWVGSVISRFREATAQHDLSLSGSNRNGHVPLAHAQGLEAQFLADARRAMARNALPAYFGSV